MSTLSSLSNWHRAVSQVPLDKILPLGYGGLTDYANIAAYYGDKRIGYEVALELEKLCAATSPGTSTSTSSIAFPPEGTHRFHASPAWLSSITQQAISNKLFKDKFSDILPLHSKNIKTDLLQTQVHDAGTMVEAAIDAVAKLENSQENRDSSTKNPSHVKILQETALSELAKYLIQTTLAQGPVNAKGRLLEAGGTVKAEIVTGESTSHISQENIFRAVAHLGGTTCHAEGRSKREAEQAAATKVLHLSSTSSSNTEPNGGDFFHTTERVNVSGKVEETQAVTGEADSEAEENTLDSNLFWELKLDEQSTAMNLKNGESPEEWWKRGANRRKSAHHRAMMAPFLFPEQVKVVQCWFRRPDTPDAMSSEETSTPLGSPEEETQTILKCFATSMDHGCTVLMVVIGHSLSGNHDDSNHIHNNSKKPIIRSFVEHGPTKSRAVRLAGIAVNRYIATEILGYEDFLNEETE